jgi:hypothetical protein
MKVTLKYMLRPYSQANMKKLARDKLKLLLQLSKLDHFSMASLFRGGGGNIIVLTRKAYT